MAAKARKKVYEKYPATHATMADFIAAYNFTPAEIRRAERIVAEAQRRLQHKIAANASTSASARRKTS
jgi:hypothetical protein